jgi:hypothetical protein
MCPWSRKYARAAAWGLKSPHAGLLPRYQHLRQIGLPLNNQLMKMVSRSALDEGGKKLGLLKGKTLYLETEDEGAVLMDYCIHDVRRQGTNAVERFLAHSPPPEGSDEWVLLQAKRQAWYSLFAVESVERGVGVQARDLLRDEPQFLVDIGFGSTASAGMVLATRVMAPEGIVMTTGAALPAGELSEAEQARFLEQTLAKFKGADFRALPPARAAELSATLIRACLRRGAAERIRYV